MGKPSFDSVRVVHKVISTLYPDLFSLEKPVPFRVGFYADIKCHFPRLSGTKIKALLWWLTNRKKYLESCQVGAQRFGFDGPSGVVEVDEAEWAVRQLRERAKAPKRDQSRAVVQP